MNNKTITVEVRANDLLDAASALESRAAEHDRMADRYGGTALDVEGVAVIRGAAIADRDKASRLRAALLASARA